MSEETKTESTEETIEEGAASVAGILLVVFMVAVIGIIAGIWIKEGWSCGSHNSSGDGPLVVHRPQSSP